MGDILFSQAGYRQGGPSLKFRLIERKKIGDANFQVFEMLILLLEFLLFFIHLIDYSLSTNSDFRMNATHLHRVDQRIYILRARIIELYNIRFYIAV